MEENLWSKKRAACERWKLNNRERYLQKKRILAHRPEYLAHRRTKYRQRRDEMVLKGFLPKRSRTKIEISEIKSLVEKSNDAKD